ncbi:MAG TPA: PEP-utilizing enzyme [Candidatus Paceibacterota bacterium]|nr:PEP-utilizing enzyme [Candidatus Paceibacterota bacterium]
MKAVISPIPASPGTGVGPVRVVDDDTHNLLRDGEVLVSTITEVAYLPAMQRAAAIVTEEGGLLSHAALVARELGKPCVVGVKDATTILRDGEIAEVDGTVGTVRQGALNIGAGGSNELDWRYLYLYDRGFEINLSGTPVYLEPTLDGLFAFVDDELEQDALNALDAEIRRKFFMSPNIVSSDRRIWFNEWRRYNQLRTVTLMDAAFSSAISSWNYRRLEQSIDTLRSLVIEIENRPKETGVDLLFWGELGAALHALGFMLVEGRAVWSLYRDTATMRANQNISVSTLLQNTNGYIEHFERVDGRSIGRCLDLLGEFRNSSYTFFAEHGVFDSDYFGSREALIEAAGRECGLAENDTDVMLDQFYKTDTFDILDRGMFRFASDLLAR